MEGEGRWIRSLENSDSSSSPIPLSLTSLLTSSFYLSLSHFLYLKNECVDYMISEVFLSLMVFRLNFI